MNTGPAVKAAYDIILVSMAYALAITALVGFILYRWSKKR